MRTAIGIVSALLLIVVLAIFFILNYGLGFTDGVAFCTARCEDGDKTYRPAPGHSSGLETRPPRIVKPPAPPAVLQQQQQTVAAAPKQPDIIIHNHIPPQAAPAALAPAEEVMRPREPVARYDYRDEEYYRRRVERDRDDNEEEPRKKKGTSTGRKVAAIAAGTGAGAGIGYLRNRCPEGLINGALSGGGGSAVAVLIAGR